MLQQHQGLGVFILVCANAGFDPQLWLSLEEKLRTRFFHHAGEYREALQEGSDLPDADDDVMVFLKMLAIGFEALQLTERRKVGPWELQFNQLRSFRPPRMAHQKVDSLHSPFNENGFQFNKPFLRKECFWSGELAGREVELLYNKFPFVDNHGLLVPQREHNAPQFLTHDDHRYLWGVCEQLGETLPGVGFGYNAYGAYSSVNHLHFQMFLRQAALPVQDPKWQHNGGAVPYPSTCTRFSDVEQAWQYIESLHQDNTAYNLLYVPGEIYCMARRMQGSYMHSEWTGGFAWYEMCGGMICFNRQQYDSLDEETISGEFAKLQI
jgi:ATP adenylyltransferase/5',5'''-P-1,P-4-tetraphosphate phosphorylase II